MWIDELAEYVEAAGIEDYDGVVYAQTLPPHLTEGVMVSSTLVGIPVDPELPGFHQGGFQMVARAKTSERAEVIAQAVIDAIETEESVMLDTIKINYIRPRHLPVSFPRSEGDHYEAVVNFDLCFVRL